MPTWINFGVKKIATLAFESEEDFFGFLKKMDYLFNNLKSYPVFYVLADPSANKDDVGKIEHFIKEMKRMQVDLQTVKRNVDAGRFPDVTGTKEKKWDES